MVTLGGARYKEGKESASEGKRGDRKNEILGIRGETTIDYRHAGIRICFKVLYSTYYYCKGV